MALGALIAGLLLAGTEYRRQVEVTIEPFKGLLLGVFLISVGMSLDLGHIVADAPHLLAARAALVAAQAGADRRRWRAASACAGPTGVQAGLLLGAGRRVRLRHLQPGAARST